MHAINDTVTNVVLVGNEFRNSVVCFATDGCVRIEQEYKLCITVSIKMCFWATYTCYLPIIITRSSVVLSLRYKNNENGMWKVLFIKRELSAALSHSRSKKRNLTRRARNGIFYVTWDLSSPRVPGHCSTRICIPRSSSCWKRSTK